MSDDAREGEEDVSEREREGGNDNLRSREKVRKMCEREGGVGE